MKKMLLAGVGVTVLLGVAVGATVFVMRPSGEAAAPVAAAAMPEAVPVEVFYHHVQPEFVVNIDGPGRARYLMVELSVATDDIKARDALDANQPELRNELLMLLGEQELAALGDNDGKTALRASAKERIEALVTKHYAPEHVLDVYLTRFVIQ